MFELGGDGASGAVGGLESGDDEKHQLGHTGAGTAVGGGNDSGDDFELVVGEQRHRRKSSVSEQFRARAERQRNAIARKLEQFGDDKFFAHEKHVFVLSWSGRPIYSLYGEETDLASFMGVISAIVSTIDAQNDKIRCVVAGDHHFVFSIRGPLYLICVHNTGQSQDQIVRELGVVHSQIISVLTSNIVKILEQKPNYDVRHLLGGTDNLLHQLISDFDTNPRHLLNSNRVFRLEPSIRSDIGSVMRRERKSKEQWGRCLYFSLLIAGSQLVQMLQPKKEPLSPGDIALLIHFVTNSPSLREAESWTPICMPGFRSEGFFYAHVCFLARDVCLVLLSTDKESFGDLQSYKDRVEKGLRDIGSLSLLEDAMKTESHCFSISDVLGYPKYPPPSVLKNQLSLSGVPLAASSKVASPKSTSLSRSATSSRVPPGRRSGANSPRAKNTTSPRNMTGPAALSRSRTPEMGISAPNGLNLVDIDAALYAFAQQTPLRHFLYRNRKLSQYVSSRYSAPYNTPARQRRLFRQIQLVHSRVAELKEGDFSTRTDTYFETSETETIFVQTKAHEWELYVTLVPFSTKEDAMRAASDVLRWVKQNEQNLFIMSPKAW